MVNETSIEKVFSENLRYYLLKAGKSQRNLSNYTGVSDTAVSKWAKGIGFPQIDKLDKICDFLNISRAQLVTERREGLYQTILGENEYQVLSKYSSLNIDGKQKILAYIDDLIASHQYDKGMPLKKTSSDVVGFQS